MMICESVADVIDKLGGNRAVGTLTRRSMQAVSNWKAAGKFPASMFLVMSSELASRGYAASPALWRIEPRPEPQSASELPHNPG